MWQLYQHENQLFVQMVTTIFLIDPYRVFFFFLKKIDVKINDNNYLLY